ncbi:MAG: FKBP-type peptidyl-prolyl cis-trans isomerase [Nanoarchaeota archaeon]
MAIKKGDFIEIDYTGRVADNEKFAFDTNDENVAKEEGIHSEKTTYGSTTIVVGEGHVIKGLDRQLEGKEPGKHTFKIPAEEAFGKKSGKQLKLVPAKVFRKQDIRPFVGLQVNVDDEIGVIRSVSGGRIIVDFNHPLASKDVLYEVDIKRVLDDDEEKIEKYFSLMGLPHDEIIVDGKKATVKTPMQYPLQLVEQLTTDLKRMTGLENITFEAKQDEKATASDTQEDPTTDTNDQDTAKKDE